MTEIIIVNAARCLECGDVIESKHRHDFKQCSCAALFVDGGTDYIRRGWKSPARFTNLNVTVDPALATSHIQYFLWLEAEATRLDVDEEEIPAFHGGQDGAIRSWLESLDGNPILFGVLADITPEKEHINDEGSGPAKEL